MPVDVVSNPAAPLAEFDLAVLVVESVEPPLRAAVTRVLTEGVAYVVLIRRDVWSAASTAVHRLRDEVQRDPRRKLIRFWRDRADLERTLREAVFTLDDATLVSQTLRDGAFVDVSSTFDAPRSASFRRSSIPTPHAHRKPSANRRRSGLLGTCRTGARRRRERPRYR